MKCTRISLRQPVFQAATIALLLGASQTVAQEWNVQDGDKRLSSAELKDQLIGQELVFETGQRAAFKQDGTYEFHMGGKVYEYSYMFTQDGVICITSPDQGSRCDLMVRNSGSYVSINESGDRYQASVE